MKELVKEYILVALLTIALFIIFWVLYAPKVYVFPVTTYSCAANGDVFVPNDNKEIYEMINGLIEEEDNIYLINHIF